MLDPELLKQAQAERDRLHELQHDVERARSDYHHTIRRLSASGASLREIADALGLSHQRVHQIVDAPTGDEPPHPFPIPGLFGRGRAARGRKRELFERFSDEARRVVVLAQEQARELRHNYVGTEHLLLGLMRLEEGAAADVLRTLGVTREAAATQVVSIVGEGEAEATGPLPFTPRAKKALEQALREKRARGARCIEPVHILLVLAREPETVSAQVLARLAVTEEKLRAAVDRRLAA
jgi:hypothetical protein